MVSWWRGVAVVMAPFVDVLCLGGDRLYELVGVGF